MRPDSCLKNDDASCITPNRTALETVTVELTLLREIFGNTLFFFADSTVAAEPYNICESEREPIVTTIDLTPPASTAPRTRK